MESTGASNNFSSASGNQNGSDASYTSLLIRRLRNPFTNIEASGEMLNSGIHEDELRLYVDSIKKDSRRINSLLNELLKSIGSGEAKGQKHSVLRLLDEVLTSMSKEINRKNIRVKKEYGEQDSGFIVSRPGIMVAFTSIIENSLDAMSPGAGELKLVTRLLPTGYVVEIWDNGKGMNTEILEKLFTPFFTTKPGGLGLGLATAAEILFRNNASVKVESKENEGTGFILLFESK